ncbi:unnamed protein product, partial [Ectocarpus fasciculatus]
VERAALSPFTPQQGVDSWNGLWWIGNVMEGGVIKANRGTHSGSSSAKTGPPSRTREDIIRQAPANKTLENGQMPGSLLPAEAGAQHRREYWLAEWQKRVYNQSFGSVWCRVL